MELKIFSGSSHPAFAQLLCNQLGVPLGKLESKIFNNDNRFIKILEPVYNADVFVVQTSVPPVDSHLMELLAIIRALRDEGAGRITAVIPYFPYVRSDKRDQPGVALTAKLVADMLSAAGAHRVITAVLHAAQIQGFFNIPCDNLSSISAFQKHIASTMNLADYTIVASDFGAAKMLQPFLAKSNVATAVIKKFRTGNDDVAVVGEILGEVRGKKTILIDDETVSGSMLRKEADLLLAHGAISVDACVAHAVLMGNWQDNLTNTSVGRFITTNTIPHDEKVFKNKETVDVSPLFAERIRILHGS